MDTTTDNGAERIRCGNRLAILAPLAEARYTVWVGYVAGDDEIGANWFKGRTTCGAEYANIENARRAAYKFLNH